VGTWQYHFDVSMPGTSRGTKQLKAARKKRRPPKSSHPSVPMPPKQGKGEAATRLAKQLEQAARTCDVWVVCRFKMRVRRSVPDRGFPSRPPQNPCN
jgi:hypothetical protein